MPTTIDKYLTPHPATRVSTEDFQVHAKSMDDEIRVCMEQEVKLTGQMLSVTMKTVLDMDRKLMDMLRDATCRKEELQGNKDDMMLELKLMLNLLWSQFECVILHKYSMSCLQITNLYSENNKIYTVSISVSNAFH